MGSVSILLPLFRREYFCHAVGAVSLFAALPSVELLPAELTGIFHKWYIWFHVSSPLFARAFLISSGVILCNSSRVNPSVAFALACSRKAHLLFHASRHFFRFGETYSGSWMVQYHLPSRFTLGGLEHRPPGVIREHFSAIISSPFNLFAQQMFSVPHAPPAVAVSCSS
mgnify:FL=1